MKIRGLVLVVCLLACVSAFANQSVTGYCSNGGVKVSVAGQTSTTNVMASYPGCMVTVNVVGGGLATIFSDSIGTPLGNPFQASTQTGQFTFFAANGHYSITLSGGTPSLPSPVTIPDVLLNDPSSSSITQASVTANSFISSSANPALSGIFRAASTDLALCFRIFGNAADACIKKSQAAGGNQPADMLDFTQFGAIEANSYETRTANPAVTGVLSCAASDTCVAFRNQTNTADVSALAKDSSDRVVVGGSAGLSTAAVNNTGNETIAGTLTAGASSLGPLTVSTITASSEVAPSATGGQLGDTAHRWDAFLRNADIVSLLFSSIISNAANPAASGFLRLATGDTICFRNAANGADVCLSDPGAAAPATGNLADLLKWSGGGYQSGAFVDTSAAPARSGVLRVGNNVAAVVARNQAGIGDLTLLQSDTANNAQIVPPIRQVGQAAPSGIVSSGLLWYDSGVNRWMVNNNNTGPVQAVVSGVDINTSDQVTVTHLAAALPVAQGGTAVTDFSFSGNTHKACTASGALTSGNVVSFDASGNCVDSGQTVSGIVTAASSTVFTNKTYDTAGSGNVFKINGTSVTAVTGTGAVMLATSPTNVTLDAEGTGNTITIPVKVWLPAAGCNNATASTFWDLPTATAASPACVTGTNTQKGVLDYADTAGGFSAQTTELLPADFTGNIDARIIWFTTATSGNAVWSLSTICTPVNASATDDPAFNTASTVTTAAPGVANQIQTSSITAVTITGCTAGQLLHVKLFRDGANASDTITATARFYGLELTIRRAM